MLLSWDTPARSFDTWVDDFTPYFAWWLIRISPVLSDALMSRQWQEALALLDWIPLPSSLAEAQERCRRFTTACWRIWDAHEQRLRQRPAPRRRT